LFPRPIGFSGNIPNTFNYSSKLKIHSNESILLLEKR
jgi:hypothetical protein